MSATNTLTCTPFPKTPKPSSHKPHLSPLIKHTTHFAPLSYSSSSVAFSSAPKLMHLEKDKHNCCKATRRKSISGDEGGLDDEDGSVRRVLQFVLWAAEGVYIAWLFLLPYAPMSEGLFNFVIGWTLMFAPLLFTDRRRDRYKGSLDILWGFQMFLTNTFLIPYMAIRLNEADGQYTPRKTSQLGTVMTNGAAVVGLVGGAVCLISVFWALFGREDGNFGTLTERWDFLLSYLGSERLAYAFIWDICLYTVFQPWLIHDNLQNIEKSKITVVSFLKFVPVIGLVAYLLSLNLDEES
uniref:Transmembrane protein n=1 Tax=Daucus carota subsp. sativus TaxID=79200 RepID=A0A175YQV2_DAUCS